MSTHGSAAALAAALNASAAASTATTTTTTTTTSAATAASMIAAAAASPPPPPPQPQPQPQPLVDVASPGLPPGPPPPMTPRTLQDLDNDDGLTPPPPPPEPSARGSGGPGGGNPTLSAAVAAVVAAAAGNTRPTSDSVTSDDAPPPPPPPPAGPASPTAASQEAGGATPSPPMGAASAAGATPSPPMGALLAGQSPVFAGIMGGGAPPPVPRRHLRASAKPSLGMSDFQKLSGAVMHEKRVSRIVTSGSSGGGSLLGLNAGIGLAPRPHHSYASPAKPLGGAAASASTARNGNAAPITPPTGPGASSPSLAALSASLDRKTGAGAAAANALPSLSLGASAAASAGAGSGGSGPLSPGSGGGPMPGAIDLSHRQLQVLPVSVLSPAISAGLLELHVPHNRLSGLPDALLLSCKQLQVLVVDHNFLTALPADMGVHLKQLTVLRARSNRLTTLPASLAQLTKLATLDVFGNELTSLTAPFNDPLFATNSSQLHTLCVSCAHPNQLAALAAANSASAAGLLSPQQPNTPTPTAAGGSKEAPALSSTTSSVASSLASSSAAELSVNVSGLSVVIPAAAAAAAAAAALPCLELQDLSALPSLRHVELEHVDISKWDTARLASASGGAGTGSAAAALDTLVLLECKLPAALPALPQLKQFQARGWTSVPDWFGAFVGRAATALHSVTLSQVDDIAGLSALRDSASVTHLALTESQYDAKVLDALFNGDGTGSASPLAGVLQELDLTQTAFDVNADLPAVELLSPRHTTLLPPTAAVPVPDSLRVLSKLTTLKLSACGVTTLPPWFGAATAGGAGGDVKQFAAFGATLQALDLSYCKLTALPDALCGLTSLTRLDLSWNRIASLPSGFGALTNLQHLNLQRNPPTLTALPDSMAQLAQLHEFNVDRCKGLSVMPAWVGTGWKQLRRLTWSGANLSALPDSIGDLALLEELFVEGNALSALPATLGRCTSLVLLNVSSNHLTALPDSLNDLCNLSALDARHNQLTVLPPFVSTTGSGPTKLALHLKILTVADNQLTRLPDSLTNLTALEHLNAESNKLTSLPSTITVATMPHLRILRLKENELSAIPFGIGTFGGGSSGPLRFDVFDVRSNPLLPEMQAMLNPKLDGGLAVPGGAAGATTAVGLVVHKSLLDFLRQGYNQGYDAATRVKLMTLGDTNAGKTQLLKSIQSLLAVSKKKTVSGASPATPSHKLAAKPVDASPSPSPSSRVVESKTASSSTSSSSSSTGSSSSSSSSGMSSSSDGAIPSGGLVNPKVSSSTLATKPVRAQKKSLSIDVCARDGIQWVMFDFPGTSSNHISHRNYLAGASSVLLLCLDISHHTTPDARLKSLRFWLNLLPRQSARYRAIIVGTHSDLLPGGSGSGGTAPGMENSTPATVPSQAVTAATAAAAAQSAQQSAAALHPSQWITAEQRARLHDSYPHVQLEKRWHVLNTANPHSAALLRLRFHLFELALAMVKPHLVVAGPAPVLITTTTTPTTPGGHVKVEAPGSNGGIKSGTATATTPGGSARHLPGGGAVTPGPAAAIDEDDDENALYETDFFEPVEFTKKSLHQIV